MHTHHSIVGRTAARLSALIIALMPFHAFMSVWLSSLVGYYTAVRLWKEVLLLLLVAGCVYLYAVRPQVRRALHGDRLFWLIGGYLLLILVTGLAALVAGGVNAKSFLYGAVLDSRFLLFFAVTWLTATYWDGIVRYWKRLLLIPAAGAIGFGVLQLSVLPADVLRHFGYGPDTIAPSSTVDEKSAYTRVQSTLRGANPFGAYLALVLTAVGGLLLRTRALRPGLVVLYLLGGLALLATYSRSAWLGALVAAIALLWMVLVSAMFRKGLVIAGVSAAVTFAATSYLLRDNDTFQNLVFHTDEKSRSAESSNSGHFRAMASGLEDIVRAPWGGGTGTAGPASFYNDAPPRIAENYFIQIGQEAGVAAVALFMAINAVIARRLYQRSGESLLCMVLLASLLGLTVVNMLLHAWTDDTLAYIWWGLAGAALAPQAGKARERAAS